MIQVEITLVLYSILKAHHHHFKVVTYQVV